MSHRHSPHGTVHLRSRQHPDAVFVVATPPHAVPRRRTAYVCDVFAVTGACPRGPACPDVHTSLAKAQRLMPHVRDRESGRASSAHRRYASALGHFTVAQPNAGAVSVHVRADECLVTRAVNPGGRTAQGVTVLNVCAHFQRKGACDYGAECNFVHPVGSFTHVKACDPASPPPALQPVRTRTDSLSSAAPSPTSGLAPYRSVVSPTAIALRRVSSSVVAQPTPDHLAHHRSSLTMQHSIATPTAAAAAAMSVFVGARALDESTRLPPKQTKPRAADSRTAVPPPASRVWTPADLAGHAAFRRYMHDPYSIPTPGWQRAPHRHAGAPCTVPPIPPDAQ